MYMNIYVDSGSRQLSPSPYVVNTVGIVSLKQSPQVFTTWEFGKDGGKAKDSEITHCCKTTYMYNV